MNTQDEEKQLSRWLILAMTAPLAEYAGAGYMAVILAAGAMLPLAALTGSNAPELGKGWSILEWLWTGVVLGTLLPASGGYWPGEKSEIAVPLVIIALAVCSGGGKKGVRIGNTLFWLAAVPAAMILFVLTGSVEPELLTPVPEKWNRELLAVLLIPALAARGTTTGRGKTKSLIQVAVTAGILAVVIQGGLGQPAAKEMNAPLYELGRCVGNGGFEIVVSVVMTLGWYALAALMIGRGAAFGEDNGIRTEIAWIVPGVVAAGMILLGYQLDGMILTGGCLILWILLPILSGKNKSKKDEKRC